MSYGRIERKQHIFSNYIKMRIVPSKIKSNPKQSDAKKDILDLLKKGRANRYRNIKKQPRIKPRYGIFGNSVWATVKRIPPTQPIDDIAQSQVVQKPITERVRARIDGNLDFLLKNHSEKNLKLFRPAESYINLAINKRNEHQNLSQQSKHNKVETNENVIGGSQASACQITLHDDNGFPNSPTLIDLTTPKTTNDVPITTPFFEYNGTINSMDFNVANVFDKEPLAVFETPSKAFPLQDSFNDNITAFNGHTFDVNKSQNQSIFDVHNEFENSPNMSGWSTGELCFDDYYYSSNSENLLKTHHSPSRRCEENSTGWTSDIANYSTAMRQQSRLQLRPQPQQQPLSEQSIERIRSKINEKMLESIRCLNNFRFSSVCDNSNGSSWLQYGTKSRFGDKQTVAENWPTASMNNCRFPSVCDDSYGGSCVAYGTEWQLDDKQTVAENRPATSMRSTYKTMTTAYNANQGSTSAVEQIFNAAFFRNNNVTIVQTCTRILKSSAVNNTFSEEYGFYQNDDNNDDDVFNFEF